MITITQITSSASDRSLGFAHKVHHRTIALGHHTFRVKARRSFLDGSFWGVVMKGRHFLKIASNPLQHCQFEQSLLLLWMLKTTHMWRRDASWSRSSPSHSDSFLVHPLQCILGRVRDDRVQDMDVGLRMLKVQPSGRYMPMGTSMRNIFFFKKNPCQLGKYGRRWYTPLMHLLIVYCPHFNFWTSFGYNFAGRKKRHQVYVSVWISPTFPIFPTSQKETLGSWHPLSFSHTSRIPKKSREATHTDLLSKISRIILAKCFFNSQGITCTKKKTSYPVFMEKIPTISVVDNETGNTAISVRKGCSSIYIPMVQRKRATKVSPIGPPKFIMLKKYQ